MQTYYDTFIQVSTDCPVTTGVIPVTAKESKPQHVIQFELLSQNPYKYTQEDIIYEVYIRHKAIPDEELIHHGHDIRRQLFQKNHPCMRASMLPKKYGWGAHFNDEGKIALYGRESAEYKRFAEHIDCSPQLFYAMRSSRA